MQAVIIKDSLRQLLTSKGVSILPANDFNATCTDAQLTVCGTYSPLVAAASLQPDVQNLVSNSWLDLITNNCIDLAGYDLEIGTDVLTNNCFGSLIGSASCPLLPDPPPPPPSPPPSPRPPSPRPPSPRPPSPRPPSPGPPSPPPPPPSPAPPSPPPPSPRPPSPRPPSPRPPSPRPPFPSPPPSTCKQCFNFRIVQTVVQPIPYTLSAAACDRWTGKMVADLGALYSQQGLTFTTPDITTSTCLRAGIRLCASFQPIQAPNAQLANAIRNLMSNTWMPMAQADCSTDLAGPVSSSPPPSPPPKLSPPPPPRSPPPPSPSPPRAKSPPPVKPLAALWRSIACKDVFGNCNTGRGNPRMPYALANSTTVTKAADGFTEITFTLAPVAGVDSSKAKSAWTLMFMVEPACVGTTPIYSRVIAPGTKLTTPHFENLSAEATSRYPATECAALKLTALELTPEQAASGGAQILLRFWPSGACKTLADFCGSYAGTAGSCVYAFGDKPCDNCPHMTLSP
ncbi:hypothetical protein HXX76_003257 [Chlamydomonas incerta]|uniref:Pherophorin domain-containing protein n=1 Tax=Chlamydomonas incerta TaxID=51695 RepID=A0A835TA51_CHLIN|nr:hypothetical protein HXX76_003257 [Chlamydomonas incerta]|eukprot:KAG2441639.1 hypothetical protein HXX76_003257 [Chlamydomonas incerta]